MSAATAMYKTVLIHKIIVDGTQFIAKVPAGGINYIEPCPRLQLHCKQIYITKLCLIAFGSNITSAPKLGSQGAEKPQYKFLNIIL